MPAHRPLRARPVCRRVSKLRVSRPKVLQCAEGGGSWTAESGGKKRCLLFLFGSPSEVQEDRLGGKDGLNGVNFKFELGSKLKMLSYRNLGCMTPTET